MIEIYTDGSNRKNGCGYGVVVVKNGTAIFTHNCQHSEPSTNQIMELKAAIAGCAVGAQLAEPDETIVIYSDSAYVVNCYTDRWWINWVNNNWINSKKDPVANKDLWEKLIPYFQDLRITFKKVSGHAGIEFNELADKLATGTFKGTLKT